MRGNRVAFADRPFLGFVIASILMILVYQLMYSSLSVFLRDVHPVDPQSYGLIMSTSAVTVVQFQFSVTGIVKQYPPFLMRVAAAWFYMIGFTMYGFVATIPLFMLAMAVITIGEMVAMPTSSTLVAAFAPQEMRACYMGVFGFAWAKPAMVGPWAAGIIIDNYNPNYVWYIGGLLCVIAVFAFYYLHIRLGRKTRFQPQPADLPAQAPE